MTTGWVKLHRKTLEWEWFDDDNTFRLFILLLLSANHKDGSHRGVDIKRGQLKTGRKQLAERAKMSEQNIRTALSNLKSTGEITIKPTSHYSIITLVNWDTYQITPDDTNQPANQQVTNAQPTLNQRLTTNKNGKNDKNEKNEKKYNPKRAADGLDWIGEELWYEWIDHKRRIGASVSERAIKQNINFLRMQGEHAANDVIAQSLDNGWKGLFELKTGPNAKPKESSSMEVLRRHLGKDLDATHN